MSQAQAHSSTPRSLDAQREEFARRRFLAMPLAGTLAWRHWIGAFHAIARTLLLVATWYGFPEQRFVVLPAVIVGIYIITMLMLERRWRRVNGMALGMQQSILNRASAPN